MYNVQSLETMGKLSEVNGYVRATIDKLEGMRGSRTYAWWLAGVEGVKEGQPPTV